MINWDNARFFLAVARTGTLRGAAAQLDVDQATVGRRIAALEETLSTTLFLRTPALFVLTPAGEALLGAAETMEQAALSIERRIAGLDDQLAGTIRVATTDSLGKQFVVPAIARLRRAHPGIEIVCVTSAQIANLTRREADVAIRTLRPDAPDLIARKLAQLEVGIDMTLRVNREIGFQVASTHEFPEGGAAVSLDGGSHFYEQEVVKAFHDLTHESSTRSFGRVQFGSAVAGGKGGCLFPGPPSTIAAIHCGLKPMVAPVRLQCLTAFYPPAPGQPHPVCALRRNHLPGTRPILRIGCISNPAV